MKIIQVVPYFGLGGAEIMCENLVYELKTLGHQVIAISLFDTQTPITERLKENGIDVRYLGKKRGFDVSVYKKLRIIFSEEKPDVIHTHIHTTQYVFPIAKKMHIKVIHTVHSVATKEASKLLQIFNGIFYRRFNVVPVALSNNIRCTIRDVYHLKTDEIPVVFNGVDLSKCRVKDDYSSNGVFKIVHVGSFLEVKNHIGMINAFEIFHNKYPNSELHLIGDGERRVCVEKFVRDKNLNNFIIFHGFQSNVHEFLHDMDVFTLPSLYEGVPMSIVEAMGSALPIVATKVGGVPDMLDENSALLVPVEVEAIAEAYERYYKNPELRKLHGESAFKLSKNFSAKNMAEKYKEIYEQNSIL